MDREKEKGNPYWVHRRACMRGSTDRTNGLIMVDPDLPGLGRSPSHPVKTVVEKKLTLKMETDLSLDSNKRPTQQNSVPKVFHQGLFLWICLLQL